MISTVIRKVFRPLAEKTLSADDDPREIHAKLAIVPVTLSASFVLVLFGIRSVLNYETEGPTAVAWHFLVAGVCASPFVSAVLFKKALAAIKVSLAVLGFLVPVQDFLRKGRYDHWMLLIPLNATTAYTGVNPTAQTALTVFSFLWVTVKTIEDAERFGLWDLLEWNDPLPAQGWQWGVGALTMRLMVCYISFAMFRLYATQLQREKAALQDSVFVAGGVAAALVRFDLDEAQLLVDEVRELRMAEGGGAVVDQTGANEQLLNSFEALLKNLRLYRPYLPASVVQDGEDDNAFSDDTEGVDETASTHLGSRTDSRLTPPPSGQVSPQVSLGKRPTNASPRNDTIETQRVSACDSFSTDGAWSVSENPLRSRSQVKVSSRRGSANSLVTQSAQRVQTQADADKKRKQLSTGMSTRRGSVMLADMQFPGAKTQGGQETFGIAEAFIVTVLQLVKSEDGVVLQFRADAATASWNVLKSCYRHSLGASNCALGVSKKVRALPREVRPARCTLTCSTGVLYTGKIGTDMQRTPFALGEPLEHVEFLAHLCRSLHARVLGTERLYEMVKGVIPGRLVDVVLTPSGWLHKATTLEASSCIYELGVPRDEETAAMYATAFSSFRKHDFRGALDMFERVWESVPDDAQTLRLMRLAAHGLDTGPGYFPRPYYRTFVGWHDFEEASRAAKLPAHIRERNSLSLRRYTMISEVSDESCPESPVGPEDAKLRMEIQRAREEALNNTKREKEESNTAKDDLSDDSQSETSSVTSFVPKVPAEFVDRKRNKWYRGDKVLGRGAFGEVRLGMGDDGALVAMKALPLPVAMPTSPTAIISPTATPAARRRQMRKGGRGPSPTGQSTVADELEDLLTEVQLLSTLRHDNIVAYLSSCVFAGQVIIVMEFVSGGSLQGVMEQFGTLPATSLKRYVTDIFRGLAFLHGNDPVIIHRDFKPHNVLLTIDGQCKLADFGASAKVSKMSGGKGKVVGTPLYMAPEACRGDITTASDIWGVGITICQMFSGSVPYTFTEDNPFDPHRFMFQLGTVGSMSPEIPVHLLSASALDLVSSCLRADPQLRPGAQELLIHGFLTH
eukprot:TRINITY_DN2480_c1_g1_i1.p1 TRINITY_DN2480_c1_g1~~TRINITY_DN2480_c1_g1_i1.p1  ORF type:complete len:1077 (+),score=265.27 TRINITY_DN2480_c1_g1_i1:53-3283(+)